MQIPGEYLEGRCLLTNTFDGAEATHVLDPGCSYLQVSHTIDGSSRLVDNASSWSSWKTYDVNPDTRHNVFFRTYRPQLMVYITNNSSRQWTPLFGLTSKPTNDCCSLSPRQSTFSLPPIRLPTHCLLGTYVTELLAQRTRGLTYYAVVRRRNRVRVLHDPSR
jgi:hypothetical protein